jgi:hypothetical protein
MTVDGGTLVRDSERVCTDCHCSFTVTSSEAEYLAGVARQRG